MGIARYQFHNVYSIWSILQKGRTSVESTWVIETQTKRFVPQKLMHIYARLRHGKDIGRVSYGIGEVKV